MSCFFENTLEMLCIAGTDGYFKRLSPAWTSTLGWSLEELQSRPFLEFVHPADRSCEAMDRLIDRGGSVRFENRFRCQDGSFRWLQWNATGSSCPREPICAVAHDITSERNLEQEILESSDLERARLGMELHDGLCQNLAGIAALSTTLSRRLEADSRVASVESHTITKLLNDAIAQARDMARGLNPLNLEGPGLTAALEGFASNVGALFQVSCHFRSDPQLPALDSEAGLQLYRIAQEAVNNAIAHGRAKNIEISLGLQGENGLLSIQDDGRGIPEQSQREEKFGMHTMGYRSRLISGCLQIQPRVSGGTSVTCLFPLPILTSNT